MQQREIKFRTFNKSFNKMNYFLATDDARYFEFANTLMQYTGLKDKNDKEIYEGDIIDVEGDKYAVKFGEIKLGKDDFDIEFSATCWHYEYNDKSGFNALVENETFETYSTGTNKVEVIGNIYENPNLLNNG